MSRLSQPLPVSMTGGEKVAAKKVEKTNMINTPGRMSELDALKSYRHKHLVRYVDLSETNSLIWIVLELATDGDFRDYMLRYGGSGAPEEAVREFTRQISSGLCYLHDEKKTVHRDIKPENILVFGSNPPTFKLTDFGTAKLLISSVGQTITGTEGYMAPEVWGVSNKSPSYSYAVDIWSLGIIIWELLIARHPIALPRSNAFNDTARRDAYTRKVTQSYVPDEQEVKDKLSQAGLLLILGMLDQAPGKRPSARTCLSHAWIKECQRRVKGKNISTT